MGDLNFIQIFVDIENSDEKFDFQCEANFDHVKRADVVAFLEYYREHPSVLYSLIERAIMEKLEVEGD